MNRQAYSHPFAEPSARDKLLGKLGIYATWLSSIAYLQKQLRIFIFFDAMFFFCDYTFSYCLKPWGMCLHIYSLPSSAFLKYHTSRFYCTWSKSHPLVDIRACTLCKVSLSSLCFSAKYWTGHRYFIHKLELYCALASKKNQYPTICLLPKWKRNGPNGTQWHCM